MAQSVKTYKNSWLRKFEENLNVFLVTESVDSWQMQLPVFMGKMDKDLKNLSEKIKKSSWMLNCPWKTIF